ncbi:MAG: histidine kinase, partial [Lachnospiraceae bacterium]|nr:histidine kinase [Lachnospiraceae bacterium]
DDSFAEREDEIGILHRQFNEMASSTAILVREKYTAELLAKEIQLQSLEKQIQPHFLYNVLQSIQWRAIRIEADDIAEMTNCLGNLLRMTLSKKDKIISLGNELELVKSFVRIQQLRFEDQIVFSLEADDELLDLAIPKLIIQPLVENAIRYAVEINAETVCAITVSVHRAETFMVIEVQNSGSSFEEDLLEKILVEKAQTHGFGISLANIYQRLRLTYNGEAEMQLVNENGLATVRIRIPFRLLCPIGQEGTCTN